MKSRFKNYISILLLTFPFLAAYSQPLKEIAEKFKNYTGSVPREEVFLHTDRSEYIAGEELWFSSYLFDRISGKPGYSSSIVYVEVLSPGNHPVGQKKIKSVNGFGRGEILLPDTLATGCYTLRAYTSMMKNNLPGGCFIKTLKVYNSLNAANGIKCSPAPDEKVKGTYYDETYISFSARRTGDNIDVEITSSDTYRSINNNLGYLFIETHGRIDYTSPVNLPSRISSFVFPQKVLSHGVNHITLFDSNGRPVSEKYIYTPSQTINSVTVSIADSCKRREHVSAVIDAGVTHFSADSGNISISIIPVTDGRSDDIASYLVFGSEFGVLPEYFTGQDPDRIPSEKMDELLSSLKSSWMDWKKILAADKQEKKDMNEKEFHFLYGRLLDKNTKAPLPDKTMFLTSPGKAASFQYAVTDKNGIFRFIIPVRENEQDLIIQPEETDRNKSVEILSSFTENYLPGPLSIPADDKTLPAWIVKWCTDYQVNRIYGTSSSGPSVVSEEKLPEKIRFYGKPDIEIRMDDYIKLPVMQEVFYELIHGASLKKHKDNYEMSLIDPVDGRARKIPPVIMIDGVIVNDANIVANIDPEIVERIDVALEKHFVGDYVFYGIVNIITRAGDFTCAQLPEHALRIKYRVIDREASFVEPSALKADTDNVPDFRNTLYWNPGLKAGKDGKFSLNFACSDVAGKYEIRIQGLNSDGKPFSASKIINVR